LIPAGASPDEAYAIQLQARDNEIQRLQRELKEAHDDRDDIIEQLKQQGITLATRPEDGAGYSDEETPSQAKSRQTEQDRMMAEWSQAENERIRQCASTQENNTDNNNHQNNTGTMQIQSSGNGVVVIGSNDYN